MSGEMAMRTTSRSSTTTRARRVASKRLPPTLPGEILLEEFLRPLNISQYALAKDISVPRRRINEIIQGKRVVTADTAVRLARYFGMSERFWLNLQARYDIEMAKDRLGDRLEQEVRARPRYFPPEVTLRGKRAFVRLPDGRVERLTPKSARAEIFDVIGAWFEAQGKLEGFLEYGMRRLEQEGKLPQDLMQLLEHAYPVDKHVLEKERKAPRKRSR